MELRQINKTNNYKLFIVNEYQREYDKKNLNNLEKDLLQNGHFDLPIIVNKQYVILDGHHRYYLLEKHNKEIEYYIIDKDNNYIKTLNEKRNKNWGLYEIIKINADMGNQTYQLLLNKQKINNLSITNIAQLYINNYSGKMYEKISNGLLTNNDIDIETGDEIIRILTTAKQEYKKNSIDVLKKYLKDKIINADELIRKIQITNKDIKGTSILEVKSNIEKIYNYKRKNS